MATPTDTEDLADVRELRSVTLDASGNVIIVDDDRGFVSKLERI